MHPGGTYGSLSGENIYLDIALCLVQNIIRRLENQHQKRDKRYRSTSPTPEGGAHNRTIAGHKYTFDTGVWLNFDAMPFGISCRKIGIEGALIRPSDRSL